VRRRALILAALLTPLLCGCPKATPVTPPTPPLQLTYSVILHWTETPATAATSYEVYRDGQILFQVQAPATSYTDPLVPAGPHSYSVIACSTVTNLCGAASNLEEAVVQ
jgi:hypothetical protein